MSDDKRQWYVIEREGYVPHLSEEEGFARDLAKHGWSVTIVIPAPEQPAWGNASRPRGSRGGSQ